MQTTRERALRRTARATTTIAIPVALAAAILGCSSSDSPAPDAAVLRPGVTDSSQVYQGTPNEHERALWAAILDASDAGRATAVQQLIADVQADPTNGYSQFLIGANAFMPPRAAVEALANGTAPARFAPSSDAATFLDQGLTHLSDPLYLGFDGMLLSGFLFAVNDPRASTIAATALQNNPVAMNFGAIVGKLSGGDGAGGLEHMYALLDFCAGAPVARDGADARQLVVKMNTGALQHRECFSGFYSPHGSSGMLQITGDLQAINGHPEAARRYYEATKQTSDYATWPLATITERRLAVGAAAPVLAEVAAIAGTCGTCHTKALR